MEEVNAKVRVGEDDYTITRFRGLKAILAGALFARVMKKMPDLQNDVLNFRKEFMQNNAIEITLGLSRTPRFMGLGLTAEDFQEAEDGIIRLPEEPTGQAIFMFVFPQAFELAQAEVTRFLALMVIPNKELEEADDKDEVSNALDKIGKAIIRSGTVDEILEVFAVSLEVFQDQIQKKRDRLGKLAELPFLRMLLSTPPEETQTNQSMDESLEELTQPISQPEAPISSDDLPPVTDGPVETPSMELLGTS